MASLPVLKKSMDLYDASANTLCLTAKVAALSRAAKKSIWLCPRSSDVKSKTFMLDNEDIWQTRNRSLCFRSKSPVKEVLLPFPQKIKKDKAITLCSLLDKKILVSTGASDGRRKILASNQDQQSSTSGTYCPSSYKSSPSHNMDTERKILKNKLLFFIRPSYYYSSSE